jgi:hypothetical protein
VSSGQNFAVEVKVVDHSGNTQIYSTTSNQTFSASTYAGFGLILITL